MQDLTKRRRTPNKFILHYEYGMLGFQDTTNREHGPDIRRPMLALHAGEDEWK